MRLLDFPGPRSSHRVPTPRGEGIAFVFVTAFSCVIALIFGELSASSVVPLIALPLALVGFLDDRIDLSPLARYCFQLFTSLVLILHSPISSAGLFFVDFTSIMVALSLAALAILVTAVINFTNFMDGLDGLLAGCMAIAIAALAIAQDASLPLWVLVGSLFGFLFWNWSPAKVFMGDVGSTFLGAVFAGLVLHAPSWPLAFGYLLVVTPLLGDSFSCLFRRLVARQRVFQAHRLHLFQLAPGRLESCSRVPHLYHRYRCPGSCHAFRRFALVWAGLYGVACRNLA